MNVTLSRSWSLRSTSKLYLESVSDVSLNNRVKGINWNDAVFMGLFHLGAVAALFAFNWKAVLVAILLWWVAP